VSTVLRAALALLLAPVALSGQPATLAATDGCQPSWLPAMGQVAGVSDGGVTPGISALAVFDDGAGPALYAGGAFSQAGGITVGCIAKWDGSTWSKLEDGGVGSEVYALTVFDDGHGPALFAAGAFSSAGGKPASHVAKWDGVQWRPVGGGMNGAVYALCVFDDGTGPALYAGGDFTQADGQPASRVARWDGAAWSALGSGVSARVASLAVVEDATGPALYVGGVFTIAGGLPANRVAKWDGSAWSPLGSGVNGGVHALAAYDDGSGPALYAGGNFTTAGGGSAAQIARWDGAAWSPLGLGLNGEVTGLSVFDEGGGPALYVGGAFTTAGHGEASGIARWDGAHWSALDTGVDGFVRAFASFDAGDGSALYAGGDFSVAGGVGGNNIARWKDAGWSQLGHGLNGSVSAFAVFDDGGGPALYIGGSFTAVDGVVARCVAKWDGESWSPLGLGMSGTYAAVSDLAVFDDGSGPALYAGGGFYFADGEEVAYVARWDGRSWSALGSGMSQLGGYFPFVYALEVFDDGSGPALYAGGGFTIAGGVTALRIAKWDGTSWSPVGGGMTGTGPLAVVDLAVFDDGDGPALYAGGEFKSAGGVTVNGIARWDGTSWSALGSGVSDPGLATVKALGVFDDGGGAALYAGGDFTAAGGTPASRIAKWSGTSWSALGSGVSGGTNPQSVNALAVFDDGSGPALYAGGTFGIAGGVAASRIAKWDGAAWSPLASGLPDAVFQLAVLDTGSGPALHAGGGFGTSTRLDSYLAVWGGCRTVVSPWTDLGDALPGISGPPRLAGTGELTPGSSGALGLSQAAPSAFALLFVSISSSPSAFGCGTLVPLPVVAQLPLSTNTAGAISLVWSAWPGGLSGLSLYFQYAIQDPAAICGVALSNALRADVP